MPIVRLRGILFKGVCGYEVCSLTSINETLELRQLGSGVLEYLEIVIEVEMSRKK